jgi:hypothetical protein
MAKEVRFDFSNNQTTPIAYFHHHGSSSTENYYLVLVVHRGFPCCCDTLLHRQRRVAPSHSTMVVSEADECAKKRSKFGLTRELSVPRDVIVHDPARGGSRGYPIYIREKVLDLCSNMGSMQSLLKDLLRVLPTTAGLIAP